jgi:hypothetical protein
MVGIVGPLPGIADIRIERDGDHDTLVIVVAAHPMSLGADGALLHSSASAAKEVFAEGF